MSERKTIETILLRGGPCDGDRAEVSDPSDWRHCSRLAREVHVNIETAIPLERAPEAFAAFADGTLGKVLITR
jgi:hypothetical protein